MTPRVERHLAEHAAGGGYRSTAASFGEFGTTLSHAEVGLGGVGVRPDRRAGEARAHAMDPQRRERASHEQGRRDVGGRPLGTPMARPRPDPRNPAGG